MHIIIFGLPGAGKTFVGNVLKTHFNFIVYEGDRDLPDRMKKAIAQKLPINDRMRDEFFNNLLESTKKLVSQHKKVAVTQTFIKEKYRRLFLTHFPDAVFLLVEAKTEIRESRLMQRKHYPLDLEYARKMIVIFENPRMKHIVIKNDSEGEKEVSRQLTKMFTGCDI